MVKKFSMSKSKSSNANPSSLALSELALNHSCPFVVAPEVSPEEKLVTCLVLAILRPLDVRPQHHWPGSREPATRELLLA